MDVNDLRVAATLLSLAVFLGIVAWAISSRNSADFDEASKLPLQEE